MLGNVRKSPDQLAAIARVTAWVRVRFGLADSDAVLVTEVVCALPGCPPLETVIAVWSGTAANGEPRRHHHKIFKPVVELTESDLPPAWFKRELAVPEDFECTCC